MSQRVARTRAPRDERNCARTVMTGSAISGALVHPACRRAHAGYWLPSAPRNDIMPMPFGGTPEAPRAQNLENNPMQSRIGVLF
jgi:hypothetical protein